MNDLRKGPNVWLVLAWVLPGTFGEVFTWLAFGMTRGYGENREDPFVSAGVGGPVSRRTVSPYPSWAPLPRWRGLGDRTGMPACSTSPAAA
jgi:hypothetical protein